jgi:hypothetical protein
VIQFDRAANPPCKKYSTNAKFMFEFIAPANPLNPLKLPNWCKNMGELRNLIANFKYKFVVEEI